MNNIIFSQFWKVSLKIAQDLHSIHVFTCPITWICESNCWKLKFQAFWFHWFLLFKISLTHSRYKIIDKSVNITLNELCFWVIHMFEMFHKSLKILPLYRFHKFSHQHSYRNCIQLCLYRNFIASCYCYAKATEKLVLSDIKKLQTLLQCTTAEADEVYQLLTRKSSLVQKIDLIECKNIAEWLIENGATTAGIRDNCHLLRTPFGNWNWIWI